MRFNSKTIWITGASSGIGRALAIAFSGQGAKLILSARNEEKLNEVKEECKNSNQVEVLPLDLASFGSFKEKTSIALSFFDGVDILINSGGISQRALAKDTELNVDRTIFAVNYFGTIGLTKAILPHFINKKSGQIVVISSVVGKIGTPLRSSYSGSKHALHGFFDSLRAELYDDNISVTLICPGFVNTNVSMNALTGDGRKQNKLDSATAKGLKPEDFAKIALRAIDQKKQEIVIAGFREKLAVYVKRFFPLLLSNIVRKSKVT